MDGPETVIALSAVARNSGPIALIFLWGPSKSHSVADGRVPGEHRSWSLSTAGLSNSPQSLDLPHPKILMVFIRFQLYHPLKRHLL